MPRRIRIPVAVHSSLLGICLALASTVSVGATYACTGTVANVGVSPNGGVSASFVFEGGSMSFQDVCNLEEMTAGVSPGTCKGILATLTTAKLSERSVTLWFNNSSGNSCNQTSWSSLSSFGWYWGPVIG